MSPASGLTVVDDTLFTGTVAYIWVDNGTEGATYTLTNHIVTSLGTAAYAREDDEYLTLTIEDN